MPMRYELQVLPMQRPRPSAIDNIWRQIVPAQHADDVLAVVVFVAIGLLLPACLIYFVPDLGSIVAGGVERVPW